MDSNQVINSFNELRSIVESADHSTRRILPCIAGRLQLSGAGKNWEDANALTALKRELRNWDITKRQWIEPR